MTETQLLDKDAFNRLVLEEKLPTWEVGGYIYTGKQGKDGYELYRTYGPKWCQLYQARRVATNANAAGHPIIIDIAIASPYVAELVSMATGQVTSGTHTLVVEVLDEDNAIHTIIDSVATGANTSSYLPNVGTTSTRAFSHRIRIGPGAKLTALTGGDSGVANDTLTVGIQLCVPIDMPLSAITWSVARSTDVANITLAASTISAANSLQPVLIP